ncbi:MAG: DASS family sodium-coupled anion symporter [Deltaproteobacteria bacterium]|nr:DASS family sodium-coupled anion symporter [Deltaproteobacteria bacterium]
MTNTSGSPEKREKALKKSLTVEDISSSPANYDTGQKGDPGHGYKFAQKIGLFLGPLLFILVLSMPTPADMSLKAKSVLASTVWIATWWITEAIPIPATSLLPMVLFPLTGTQNIKATTAAYGSSVVFLFLGGFMIAMAMERWNLHRRIALTIIRAIGASSKRIILGFMIATGFLSMWISNTATTMMLTPIGLAVISQISTMIKEQSLGEADVSPAKFNFGKALMLGIAYAASIGGVATIIGSPPNAIFVGLVNKMWGKQISFATWMLYGTPLSAVAMLCAWYYLTNIAFPLELKELPGGTGVIEGELKKLGSISRQERQVLVVFTLVAILWLTRSFVLTKFMPLINDTTIAIFGALLLFLMPANLKKGQFILDWDTAVKVPWGILLLFGGGISLAGGFASSGLATWLANSLAGLKGVTIVIIVLAVVTMTIFLTEVTSNTATATMLMPVMAALAIAMGIHPYTLMITATTACSYAFMLPVATPPNAIVFGSGYITIPQMAKAGFWMNILGVILITILALYYLPLVWGITITTTPSWASVNLG